MRGLVLILALLAGGLCAGSAAAGEVRSDLTPPVRRGAASDQAGEADRLLGLAQQLRSKAGRLRDEAESLMRRRNGADMAARNLDRAERLEEEAATLEETAYESLAPATSNAGGPWKRPVRRH